MSRLLSIFLIVSAVACAALALSSYRSEQPGKRLFKEYFSAVPSQGYAVQRAFAVGITSTDTSILRQAYAYHKTADYDLSLVSFRSFLESNPLPESDEPLLLAATSAVATGRFDEGAEYLEQIQVSGAHAAEASWHLALIDLYRGDLAAARDKLKRIAAGKAGRGFPVAQLLGEIPTK